MLAQPNARLTSKALFFLQYLVSTSSERCDVDMQESIVACASSDDFVVRLCPRTHVVPIPVFVLQRLVRAGRLAIQPSLQVREMALRVLLRLCETQPPAPPTLSAAIARRLAVLKDLKVRLRVPIRLGRWGIGALGLTRAGPSCSPSVMAVTDVLRRVRRLRLLPMNSNFARRSQQSFSRRVDSKALNHRSVP